MVLGGIVLGRSVKATRRCCGDGRGRRRRSWFGKSGAKGDGWEEVGADGARSREVEVLEGWCDDELPGLAMKRRVSTASASIAALWLAVRCFVPVGLEEGLTVRYPLGGRLA